MCKKKHQNVFIFFLGITFGFFLSNIFLLFFFNTLADKKKCNNIQKVAGLSRGRVHDYLDTNQTQNIMDVPVQIFMWLRFFFFLFFFMGSCLIGTWAFMHYFTIHQPQLFLTIIFSIKCILYFYIL